MKWLRKLLGLCEHEYVHVSNIIFPDRSIDVRMCYKCFKMKF